MAEARRTLILLRHAKSDWRDPEEHDQDRPLNRRGRLAAPLMGAWLVEMGLAPDTVFCSTAARTRETWARLAPILPDPPEPTYAQDLYLASAGRMLAWVQDAPEQARLLLMIGHSPGVEHAAALLADGQGEPLPAAFPTAAAAVLTAEIPWAEWSPGCARLAAFAAPKLLV